MKNKEKKADAPAKKKNVGNVFGIIFSVIFSIVLTAAMVLMVLVLFVHALNDTVTIPALGPVSSQWLSAFFDEWYPIALGGAVVLIPLLVIVLINTSRFRRVFLATGWSALVSAVLLATAGFVLSLVVDMFPEVWRNVFADTTIVFRDFNLVCAIILIVFGATCLSVYSSIVAAKGSGKEKRN